MNDLHNFKMHQVDEMKCHVHYAVHINYTICYFKVGDKGFFRYSPLNHTQNRVGHFSQIGYVRVGNGNL